MMTPDPEPLFIGTEARTLSAVLFRPEENPRATVVLCPPFFHEQFLSYRLLSLVARRLTELGIATLRFDYFGTGESLGDDDEFSLAGAVADTRVAIDDMRRRFPRTPLIVMGARAGSWPALAASDANVARVWLWQPLLDGARWLAELDARDADERASTFRYPLLRKWPKRADRDHLLGSWCGNALRAELGAVRAQLPLCAPRPALDVVGEVNDAAVRADIAKQLPAPPAALHWHTEIDMHAAFLSLDLAHCVDQLAAPFTAREAA